MSPDLPDRYVTDRDAPASPLGTPQSGEYVAVPVADLLALRHLRSQLPAGDQSVFERLFARIPTSTPDCEILDTHV